MSALPFDLSDDQIHLRILYKVGLERFDFPIDSSFKVFEFVTWPRRRRNRKQGWTAAFTEACAYVELQLIFQDESLVQTS